MGGTRAGRWWGLVAGAVLLTGVCRPAMAAELPAAAAGLLGIPYRSDGACDPSGRYTLFADQGQTLDTPGFNCSGLVTALAAELLGRRLSLDQARRDRLGDSGPGAVLGEDWDFGWDLLLNLSDGLPRRILLPGGRSLPPSSGRQDIGFALDDEAAWRELLPRLRPDRVYLGSLNRPTRQPGYSLLHHHTLVILADGRGGIWLYQATGRSGSHRLPLHQAAGLEAFLAPWRAAPGERLLLLEVTPTAKPGRDDD